MTEHEPLRRRPAPEAAASPADMVALHQVLIEIRDGLRQLTTRTADPAPDRPPPPDWVPGTTLYNGPPAEPAAGQPAELVAPAATPIALPDVPMLEATAPVSQESSPQPEKRRVVLAGRVGAAPAFRTTPKGQTIAQFPLGVHPEPYTTVWHTILAFGERAEQLRGQLKKGEQV